MSYSTDRAALLTQLLERMSTQHAHQIASQAANVDFWIAETGAALSALNGYPARFRKLSRAHKLWVQENDTKVGFYCPVCQGGCEFGPARPSSPRRVPSSAIDKSRRALHQAIRRFLLRMYRTELLSELEVRELCEELDVNLEPEDFE